MRLRVANTMRKRLFVSVFALVTVVMALSASSAFAGWEEFEYSGRNLAGGTWTTNGRVAPALWAIYGEANSSSSVCVGPITHDAGGYHAPYGWACAPHSRTWEFAGSPIAAAAGIYNPNPGTFGTFLVHAWSF
jgi:hypothetical protein